MKFVKSLLLSMVFLLAFALPVFASSNVPVSIKAKALSSSSITIGWNKVVGADYYHIYYGDKLQGYYHLFQNNTGTSEQPWTGTYSATLSGIPSQTTVYFCVTSVKNGVESDYSKVVKATTLKPSKAEQVATLRAQEIVAPPGSMLSLNARIQNLIIELEIHKLRYESSATFKSIVQASIMPEIEGSTLTAKARQFNSIASQVLHGSLSDTNAIIQLQALSLVP